MVGSQETGRTSELPRLPSTTEDDLIAGPHVPPTPNYPSLARGFILRLCVAVTLGLILVIGMEMFAYWRGRGLENLHHVGPEVEAAVVQGSVDEREYWREERPAQKTQYEPYVLWRRAPFNGTAISINADGIRRTFHTHCDASSFTVWMFGDSAMWGLGSPDSETIPSLVAADYENAGRQVCIVNYAERGWASTQELIELVQQLKHADRRPDVVLFYDGGTEAFAAYENKQVDVHSNYLDFKNYLDGWITERMSGFSYLSRSNTYRLLENIATGISSKENSYDNASESDAQAWSRAIMQNYLENMNIIGLLAKQYGFRPIFAWYPNMAVGHKQLTPEEAELNQRLQKKFPGLELVYRAAYEKCRLVRRPDLYYLGDILDDTKISLYRGVDHLNAAGNQIVAHRLFQLLENAPNPAIAKKPGLVSKTRSVHLSESKSNQTEP